MSAYCKAALTYSDCWLLAINVNMETNIVFQLIFYF